MKQVKRKRISGQKGFQCEWADTCEYGRDGVCTSAIPRQDCDRAFASTAFLHWRDTTGLPDKEEDDE